MDDLTLETLVGIERRGWDALCTSSGGGFYGELMTEDALMVLVNGAVLDREAVVAALDDAPAWDSYQLLEPRLVPMTPGAAALVYRAIAARGAHQPFEALMSSTYVVTGGEVRLALYQQTAAPR